ncbi:MAG TPA: 8-amino-7-oxononanoate synthase [Candidatus Limnocylindrales bacterium]|nr:8-amino-7-oxononanoate synthase [Candidatus Limnocylindrales bacterium]
MPDVNDNLLRARIAAQLENLRDQSQLRSLELSSGINLCSNDYLGLAADPRLKQAVVEAVASATQVGATGSRLLSGNSREWQELESEFADFAGTDAALYFGSGYAANLGLLSSVLQSGDIVFSDALNHASLIDGIRLSGARKIIYPHRDVEFLEKSLREHSSAPYAKLIVTESIFSMEGDVAPVNELVRLAKKYGAELVIDEAHALGVWGPQGRGIAAEMKCEREIFAVVYPCGKALASAGAFVCCHAALKEFLVNRARTFLFSTAMPPYIAGQIRAALAIARAEDSRRTYLRELSAALRQALASAGLNFGSSSTHIGPVIFGTNVVALHVASQLQAAGFIARAIRPPTVPASTARIRVSLTSRITREHVHRVVAIMNAAVRSLPSSSHSSGQVPAAATLAHA